MAEIEFSSPDYEILGKLGKGAMGVVLKARHRHENILVAIKVISPEMAKDREFAKRFLLEMGAIVSLNHPNIVKAHDYGIDIERDQLFVALEYVDGGSLQQLLEREIRLPLGQALHFTKQVAAGLEHAHEKGMIHRDIKPDNILLSSKGEAKISDFGLVKSDANSSGLTAVGAILGTPFYLAPEQAMGDGEIDIRADIYALGITLFHMLAGRPPFVGENPLRIITSHCTKPLPDIHEFVPDLPKIVVDLIGKMTQKDPKDRFATPWEVVDAIDQIEEELDPAFLEYEKNTEDSSSDLKAQPLQSEGPLSLSGDLSSNFMGLRGKLKTISLVELIQTLMMSGKSGILNLTRWDQKTDVTYQGEVYFNKGQALHAWCIDFQGPMAFKELLQWKSGKFLFNEEEEINIPATLPENTQGFLMDLLRQMDEEGSGKMMVNFEDPAMTFSGTLTGLSGNLDSINVVEVLQTINVTRKTGVLILEHGDRKGKIYFQKGQVLDAYAGELTGLEAFFDLIFLSEGWFRFRDTQPEIEQNIKANTTTLLMEACRLLQESEG